MREIAVDSLTESTKLVFKTLVETRNLNTVDAAFRQLRKVFILANQRQGKVIQWIDAEDLAYWCARGNAAYLGQLSPVFATWKMRKLEGVEAEAFEFTDSFRLPNSKDKDAVRTWDPDAGAYRPAEDAALKSALDAGFNDGSVGLYDYALARTFRGLGLRPSQLAAMKICDIRSNGNRVEVRIPLAKQRGVPERGSFLPWKPITQGLSDILLLHISENVSPRVPDGEDTSLAQLFPRKGKKSLRLSEGVEKHQSRHAVSKNFEKIFKFLDVVSPITGRTINVNPTRERHTVLTGLAMMGCSAQEIAINAGQATPESCQPYVDASIDHFQRMERLVGEAFIPIADRFLGKIIQEERDQTAVETPESILRGKDLTGVGSCEAGGCGAISAGVAPIACYTCRKFRAWADAPHENILAALIKQQRDLNAAGHSEVAETKTATIVAITDLLEAINGGDASDD
jgi:integrase